MAEAGADVGLLPVWCSCFYSYPFALSSPFFFRRSYLRYLKALQLQSRCLPEEHTSSTRATRSPSSASELGYVTLIPIGHHLTSSNPAPTKSPELSSTPSSSATATSTQQQPTTTKPKSAQASRPRASLAPTSLSPPSCGTRTTSPRTSRMPSTRPSPISARTTSTCTSSTGPSPFSVPRRGAGTEAP